MTGTPADTDITDNAHKDLISSSELFHVSQAFRYASLILVSVMFIIVSTLKAFWAFGQKSICFLCWLYFFHSVIKRNFSYSKIHKWKCLPAVLEPVHNNTVYIRFLGNKLSLGPMGLDAIELKGDDFLPGLKLSKPEAYKRLSLYNSEHP